MNLDEDLFACPGVPELLRLVESSRGAFRLLVLLLVLLGVPLAESLVRLAESMVRLVESREVLDSRLRFRPVEHKSGLLGTPSNKHNK